MCFSVREFVALFTDSRDCLLCAKQNLRTKSRANAENQPNARVIGRVRNQISQSLSRGVLAVAWRFFFRSRCFARVFRPDERFAAAIPAHPPLTNPTPNLNNGLHCLHLHRLGRRPQGVQGPGTFRATKRARSAARRVSRKFPAIRDSRAERRRAARRTRARGGTGARANRRERAFPRDPSARTGRRRRIRRGRPGSVGGRLREISLSTASAVFPDTPTAAGTRR